MRVVFPYRLPRTAHSSSGSVQAHVPLRAE